MLDTIHQLEFNRGKNTIRCHLLRHLFRDRGPNELQT